MTLMSVLNKPSLFDATSEFDRMFNQLWNEVGTGWVSPTNRYDLNVYPRVDFYEKPDALVLVADLPGVRKEDLHIEFNDGVLRISGERYLQEKEEHANVLLNERTFGKFSRSFRIPLPINADKIEAVYRNGQLMITLPKTDDVKAKRIAIKS